MQRKYTLLLLFLITSCPLFSQGFLAEQMRYPRVREAVAMKSDVISTHLAKHNLSKENIHVLWIGYKAESELVLYIKGLADDVFREAKTYRICAKSGALGPKRKQGDMQVPEGFYHIDRFNPNSNFHLSLGINYPNASDRKKSAANPGGDIFIHGSCVTVGCLPMTNDEIREIYLYSMYAKNNGQKKIPVYIFPFKMTETNWSEYREKHGADKELLLFWEQLKGGYDLFMKNKKSLNPAISIVGDYQF